MATTIDEHKQLWRECQEAVVELQRQVRALRKRQQTSTKALQAHMTDTGLASLDCGGGWTLACDEVERVTYTEEACSPYVTPEDLETIRRSCTRSRKRFRVSHDEPAACHPGP